MLARQIAVGFGIAVIFPLLVYYGVSTFQHPPKWAAFHRTSCVPEPGTTVDERKECAKKQRVEQEAYDTAAKEFARALVLVSTPLGVAAILIGAFLPMHAVGTGLILGGISSVGWGYWGYWQYLEDWMRFVSLLTGFGVLLFVGYRLFAVGRTRPTTT
jgi:hypothetical protein